MLDGAAFLGLANRLAPRSRLFALGFSLGSSVALEQAVSHRVAGVAVSGAFARLADVAPPLARPFLPDRFDNVGRVQMIDVPILIVHGTADETIPFSEAGKLLAASSGHAAFLAVQDGPHHLDFSRLSELMWREFDKAPPKLAN